MKDDKWLVTMEFFFFYSMNESSFFFILHGFYLTLLHFNHGEMKSKIHIHLMQSLICN
jgi:hypothetical protein